ncbi:FAD-binding domain-containing protein [Vararia minispora EC-137]|uniref:FAD-binding domain-containing protein n=1 Tax=Vararia minispora EC-137 TaxID=1314806 RepID=A0ACB8QH81_9AGAM|nr:FAD-binding domain-containing protein [Vararia minispora EC-137]
MMFSRALFVSVASLAWTSKVLGRCRTQPGDPGFPSATDWAAFNNTIDGRLLTVVPSAGVCAQLNCTEAQWTSSVFRDMMPGQMNQDYDAVPPELCLRNGTTCAQGNVPLYAVNAMTTEHVQAGIRFAVQHNLRVAVKASGHDGLGRSTAKHSLLIWVHSLQNITFTESFRVGGRDLGSAVTLGSGVRLQTIYSAAEQVGKMVVGGTIATAALGGGYIQGAGHSAFSPTLGLASDNALQFEIVLASGEVVVANDNSHSDLFWAVRGGGAGSWGVVTSVVVKTYPTFNATEYDVSISLPSIDAISSVMTSHAKHVFEWGDVGQYYTISAAPQGIIMTFVEYFPNTSAAGAIALMEPFWEEVRALGASVLSNSTTTSIANELVRRADDAVAVLTIQGSRLIPAKAYQDGPDGIGQVHGQLIDMGYVIIGSVVAGGKVAENANISSAVTPKWRTAKSHIVLLAIWNESTTATEVEGIKEAMTTRAVPLLANATGETDSGAYSNEADVREPDFQTTFFGGNYARLSTIKAKYDPQDLFIVSVGVGSERWDEDGLCTV